jgi:copper(I)-binding protein
VFLFRKYRLNLMMIVCLCAVLAVALVSVACTTESPDADGEGITVSDPWARAGMAGRPTAAYMVIANGADIPDRLVAAAADVAEETQVHESRMGDDGEMMMVHMEEGIEVPAGGELVLKPESYHVMLLGLTRDLVEGEAVPIVLSFENAGDITVEAEVRPMAAMGEMDHE